MSSEYSSNLLPEKPIDPSSVAKIGAASYLKQLVQYGFFHADPHPGNLLALSDGRLCYLDFGMMSEVSDQSRTGLIQAVVHLVNRNFEKLSEDFVALGFLDKNVDLRPIVPAFESVFETAVDNSVTTLAFMAFKESGLLIVMIPIPAVCSVKRYFKKVP